MTTQTQDLHVAILVVDNFEQVELTSPKQALEGAGIKVSIVSAKPGTVTGMNHDKKADTFPVDLTFEQAEADDFAAVVLPGGVFNSDAIRSEEGAQRFVQNIHEQGKTIAVICHGAWLLVSAGLVDGRNLTSWPSLKDDIRNAGGDWIDEEVVLDGNIISSRKPDDLPAFNAKLLETLNTPSQVVPAPARAT